MLASVLAAVTVALTLPQQHGLARQRPVASGSRRPVPSIGRLRLAGAAAMVTFYLLFAVVPGLVAAGVPAAGRPAWQLLLILLMAGFCWLVVDIGRDWSRRAGWGHQQVLAVITGVLLPTIVASVLLPVAQRELEPLVTVPTLALLAWLAWRYRQADRLPAGYR